MALIDPTSVPIKELLRLFTTEKFINRVFVPILPLPPSVYDWHEPTRHPKGIFRTRYDTYEWFDPIKGVEGEFERVEGSGYLVKRVVMWPKELDEVRDLKSR